MKILVAFCLFLHMNALTAQTVITGHITNSDTSQPVGGANITLSEGDETFVIAFAKTDENGYYSITYKGDKESITLTVSGFDLKKQSKTVDSRSQILNFSVVEEPIEFNEVIVKAPKIRQSGDTLNYLVSSFTDQEDRTIADVLKKMPGIQVMSDGSVLYQNRPINKFYIENLDLLQGRYGVATNNISAEDVATVQVMENHQPVRALIGKEYVNEAALNLKLKESAKGAFFMNAQAGIGATPLLLSNELFGMYFTRNTQHMSVYKGDNTGRDITNELQSLYRSNNDRINLNSPLNLVEPSSPSISQQRYLFNDTHTGTVNHLNKLGEQYVLTTNLNYIHDEVDKEGYSYSEYFLPGEETVVIEESMDAFSRKNLFDVQLNINANSDTYFLNNDVKFTGEWLNSRSNIMLNSSHVSQQLKDPDYSVSNFLDLVKTKDEKRYQLKSFVGYKSIDKTLSVTPAVFGTLFPDGIENLSTYQQFRLSGLETRNSLSWSWSGRLSLSYSAELNGYIQKLNSSLEAQNVAGIYSGESLQNGVRRDYAEAVLSASTRYNVRPTMNIMLSLPVRYIILREQTGSTNTDSYVYLDPSFSLGWQITPRWTTNYLYGFFRNFGGIENRHNNPIMINYRTLMQNDGKLEKLSSHNITWMLGYKNPFTTLFGSLNLFYTNNRSNLLYSYNYQDIFTNRQSVEKSNTRQNLFSSASIGKDIDLLSSTISLGISYINSQSEQLIQQQPVKYNTRSVSLTPRINSRLTNYASIQYTSRYSWINSQMDMETIVLPDIQTWSQRLDLNIFPTSKTIITLSGDYFRNSSVQDGSRTMWFGDIEVSHKLKRIQFFLSWNNIFNTKTYVISSYADAGHYFYSYKLRPAEVLLRVRFSIL